MQSTPAASHSRWARTKETADALLTLGVALLILREVLARLPEGLHGR